jgi:hypothetical protein
MQLARSVGEPSAWSCRAGDLKPLLVSQFFVRVPASLLIRARGTAGPAERFGPLLVRHEGGMVQIPPLPRFISTKPAISPCEKPPEQGI